MKKCVREEMKGVVGRSCEIVQTIERRERGEKSAIRENDCRKGQARNGQAEYLWIFKRMCAWGTLGCTQNTFR